MSAQFYTSVITCLIMINVFLGAVSYLILLERKIASWVQNRLGPNRTGPMGLFQPLADGLKFLLKEDYDPLGVDKGLFRLAPVLALVPALIGWAILPLGGYMTWGDSQVLVAGAPINIGVIYILAVGSLAVYGIVLGGYASNNKYTFLGGLRATAQMISYEIPLGLCVLIIILMHGTARADYLVELQANGVWNVFYQPILAMLFFICSLAECNRAPFDLAECEQELVGGFHTEYSSMKLALFFLGEYFHLITSAGILVLLFFGGWDLPFIKEPIIGETAGIGWVLIKMGAFMGKIAVVLALVMVIRWTLPRLRFDQLMKLAWQSLIPLAILMLLETGVIVYLDFGYGWLTVCNVATAALVYFILPYLPSGPAINRKIELTGSRFSPPTEVAAN